MAFLQYVSWTMLRIGGQILHGLIWCMGILVSILGCTGTLPGNMVATYLSRL